VLAFPRHRAPHHDADGGGSPAVGRRLLEGVNVLIVEDDFIVAFDMQTLLEEQGATVIGPAADLDEARAQVARNAAKIQIAVLDVNINGEYVFPVAAELRRAGVPIVFATAYADDERLFPDGLKDAPRLAKPVLPNVLVGQLKRLLV
jgi:two-component system, response regulator PdtaR